MAKTTPPSIGRVSTNAADGKPRGVAGRSQTVDVYGSPTILAGGFRLTYGGDATTGDAASITSTCIPANSTNLTAEAVSYALSAANAFLSVTVKEDAPPFDGARRFVVYFEEPEIGVGVLGVADADESCEWLQCSSGTDDDDNDGACEASGVLVNRDMSVFVEEGAVEVCGDFSILAKLHVVGAIVLGRALIRQPSPRPSAPHPECSIRNLVNLSSS